MTCCMCGRTDATIYWTIIVSRNLERQVCNPCELTYRRERSKRAAS